MSTAPTFTLNTGTTIPALGLGVFQSDPDETAAAVRTALADGYRLIDTAAAYGNEREVGQGLADSDVARDDVFVTTKLWLNDYGTDATLRAFDISANKLGVDYVDLYLLHWPVPSDFERTLAAYRAAVTLHEQGRIRAVGVSNFTAKHLDTLIAETGHTPAVNQIELHPYLTQTDLITDHRQRGILTQAWSPIGGTNIYGADEQNQRFVLKDDVVTSIAEEAGKTPAQVVLRWQYQNGVATVPKSTNPERIANNIDIFGFELTAQQMAAITALNTNQRGGGDPDEVTADSYDVETD